MLVTVTEMGERKSTVHFHTWGKTRGPYILTVRMQEALEARGRVVWSTARFGHGRLGEQRQYEVRRK